MLINSFFKLKLYYLNIGWLKNNQNINHPVYIFRDKTKLIFLNKNIAVFKKIFIVIQTIIKNNGIIFFISSYYHYFKSVYNFSFYLQEFILKNYNSGYITNYLYFKDLRYLPDCIIISSSINFNLYKEIKNCGLLSIGINNYESFSAYFFEYFIHLQNNSYFINIIIFQIYSQYIKTIKLY